MKLEGNYCKRHEAGCASSRCATDRAHLDAGLFLAPQMVGEALKGGRLIAEVMSRAGYPCTPKPGLPTTHSFITAVHLGSPAKMTAFCRAVQACCPVGSYIQPIPGLSYFDKDNTLPLHQSRIVQTSVGLLAAQGWQIQCYVASMPGCLRQMLCCTLGKPHVLGVRATRMHRSVQCCIQLQ